MRGTLRPPPPRPTALSDQKASLPSGRTAISRRYSAWKNSAVFGGPCGLPRPSHRGKLRSPPTDPQACHPGSDGPPRASRGNSARKSCPVFGGPCGLPRPSHRGKLRSPPTDPPVTDLPPVTASPVIANKTTLCCPHIKSTATNRSS